MKRAAVTLALACAGVVIGGSLVVMHHRSEAQAAPRAVAVEKLTIRDAPAHWKRLGFVEMVPSIHLPTDAVQSDHIAVWLKIPEQGRIQVRTVDGRATLKFPAGTEADRVESFGGGVVDVRGTALAENAELFHVLVPDGASLVGWEWHRNDDKAERAATEHLVRQLKKTKAAPQVVDDYTKNNACEKCHEADKPEDLRDPRAIHRRTDDSGFYAPLSVLNDVVPLEIHRPRDMNPDDPFVTIECSGGRAAEVVEDAEGARTLECADGKVPLGVLDVVRGVAARDAHALAVCASRKYLWQHMDADARAAFAKSFAECGI